MKRVKIVNVVKEEEISVYEISINDVIKGAGLGKYGATITWEVDGDMIIVKETITLSSKIRNI